MSDYLSHHARAEALAAVADQWEHPRIGIVSGYDAAHYCVKVRLQPEPPGQPYAHTETGWLPVLSLWGGPQWGDFAPPSIGDVVLVVFQEGDHESGIAIGRFFSAAKTNPLPVPAGERWIVHKSGAKIRFLNDTSLEIANGGASLALPGDGSVQITAPAGVTITGNLTVSGDIQDHSGAKGTVQHIRDSYDTHTHGGSGVTPQL